MRLKRAALLVIVFVLCLAWGMEPAMGAGKSKRGKSAAPAVTQQTAGEAEATEAATADAPQDLDVRWRMAARFLQERNYAAAKRHFDAVLKEYPARKLEVAALYRKVYQEEFDNNHLDEAQKVFEQAMAYDPSLRGAYRFYLKMAQKTTDPLKKIDFTEKARLNAVTTADRNAVAKLYLQMALDYPDKRQTYRQKAVVIAGRELVDRAFPPSTVSVLFDRTYDESNGSKGDGTIDVFRWGPQMKAGDRIEIVGVMSGKAQYDTDNEIQFSSGQSFEPGWTKTTNGYYSTSIEQPAVGQTFQMRLKKRKGIQARVRVTREEAPRVNLALLDTQEIKEEQPVEGKDYMRMAHALLRTKKYAEAEQCYDLALMQEPDNPERHFIIGQYYFQRGDPQRAQERFYSAYKLDRKMGNRISEIYQGAGEIALMSLSNENVEKAKDYYLKADYYMGGTGSVAAVPFEKGATLVKQGALDPAIKFLDVAVAINPKLGDKAGEMILAQSAKVDNKYRLYYYETAAKYSPATKASVFKYLMAQADAAPLDKENDRQYWLGLASKFGEVPVDYIQYKAGRYLVRLKKDEMYPAKWLRTPAGPISCTIFSNNDRYEILKREGGKVRTIKVWKGDEVPAIERQCDLRFRAVDNTTIGLEISQAR